MRDERFVESADVRCPSHKQHKHREQLRVIGNAKYNCDCGCEFEWYGENSWYLIHQGRYGVPEQYDLQSDDGTDLSTLPQAILLEDDSVKEETHIDIPALIIIMVFTFMFGLCAGLMTSVR